MARRALLGSFAGPALAGSLVLAGLSGCKGKSGSGPVTVGSTSVPAPIASSLPIDPKLVSAAVNPKAEAPYSGPTGTVSGVVTVSGDAAPPMTERLAVIPPDCAGARDFYARLFREGPGRTLADAVVGVTGFKGYVPEENPSQFADAVGCAWNSRTYVLTFGQSLDVRSRDSRPYVPDLIGAHLQAQLVAMPRGDAIHMYPEHPGPFALADSMRLFMLADVLVVNFSTHAVTGPNGHFVIPRVPVGKVKVSARLQATGVEATKDVEVHDGELVEVALDLPFDLAKWSAAQSGHHAPPAAPSAGAGASAAPAGSASATH